MNKRSNVKSAILAVLKKGTFTTRTLEVITGIRQSSMTAAIVELEREKKIRYYGHGKCVTTGNYAKHYTARAATPKEIEKREKEINRLESQASELLKVDTIEEFKKLKILIEAKKERLKSALDMKTPALKMCETGNLFDNEE